MSELRRDILTGEWVIYATNRRDRPYDFEKKSVPHTNQSECLFCPGHEDMTPTAVYQDKEADNWSIRVFPNMYPAVSDEANPIMQEEFYCNADGQGKHEVVVDTPAHEGKLHEFSAGHITKVLQVLQNRFHTFEQQENIRYIQVFKNSGPEAGASINHSHWQIVGIPVIPFTQECVFENSRQYYKTHQRCILCDMLQHEKEKKLRVIGENEGFLAFVPYAAKLSYEVYFVPKKHMTSFSALGPEDVKAFAEILKPVLKRTQDIMNGVSYNICFQDFKAKADSQPYYHWYVRVLPRIGNPAGFEYGTGSYINPVLPEKAAAFYRGEVEFDNKG